MYINYSTQSQETKMILSFILTVCNQRNLSDKHYKSSSQ